MRLNKIFIFLVLHLLSVYSCAAILGTSYYQTFEQADAACQSGASGDWYCFSSGTALLRERYNNDTGEYDSYIYYWTGDCPALTTFNSQTGCAPASNSSQCAGFASNTSGTAWIGTPTNGSCNALPSATQCLSSGYNCYTTAPLNASSQCGTVNGNTVCVTSSSSASTGNAAGFPNGTTPQSQIISGQPTTSTTTTTNTTNNTTTTSTTTSTPSTTTTTGPWNEMISEQKEFEYTEGSYGEPVICETGQYAASLNDCDTNVQCPSHQFVLGGICFDLPEVVTVTEGTSTTTTTETIDNGTGQVIDSTTTVGETSQPASASGTTKVEAVLEFAGPCDPSQVDYYDCLEVAVSPLPEHTISSVNSFSDANTAFYDGMQQTQLITAFNNVAGLVDTSNGACPNFSIDLGSTMIGETISTTVHCDVWELVTPAITSVMLIVFIIIGFRIVASA